MVSGGANEYVDARFMTCIPAGGASAMVDEEEGGSWHRFAERDKGGEIPLSLSHNCPHLLSVIVLAVRAHACARELVCG